MRKTPIYFLYNFSKVTASMSTNLLFVRNRFCERWVSLVADIGALMSGVMHMMRLIWDLLGV